MRDILIISIYAVPLISISIYMIFFFAIPNWINDIKWERYMEAWDKWDKNGRKGKMPVSEDFGYKNPSHKNK